MDTLDTRKVIKFMPDPRAVRAKSLEDALINEPLTPDEAWEIFDEMAEIVTDLQQNPPEFGSAEWWDGIQPIELPHGII